MELSVKLEWMSGWNQSFNQVISREELTEYPLPDALPDAARVLEVGCAAFLEVQSAQGRGSFSGRIRSEVVYQSEEGEIRSLQVVTPLQFTQELPGVEEGSVIHAVPRSQEGDVRLLNPRRLLLRVSLLVDVQVYQPVELLRRGTLPQGEDWGMEWRQQETTCQVIAAVAAKPFAFADRLALPGGGPGAASILKCRTDSTVEEARMVGSKLVIKGKVVLTFLLASQEGGLFRRSFDLPFSQILDGGGAGEEAQAQVTVTLTDCTYDLVEDGAAVEVTFDLLAQGVIREERPLCYLADAYSTRYALEETAEPLSVAQALGGATVTQELRELIQCGGALKQVVDLWASLGLTGQKGEGDSRTLTADVTVHLWVEEQEGRMVCLSRTYPVSAVVTVPPEAELSFTGRLTQVQGEVVPMGAEVRLGVVFSYQGVRRWELNHLTAVTVAEDQSWEGRPSLVLRPLGAGETLWDVGKRFHAKQGEILAASGLDGESTAAGTLLLIPKAR